MIGIHSVRAACLFAALSVLGFQSLAVASPSGAPLHERWKRGDGAAWGSAWRVSANAGWADVLSERGRLETISTGPISGPYVRARTKETAFHSFDISFGAENVAGLSPLLLHINAGNGAELTLSFVPDGRYQLLRGDEVLIDGLSVGHRPPDLGVVNRAWRVRLRVERHDGATDVFVKRWGSTAKEPGFWHHALWQVRDSVLLEASGPVEFETRGRGSEWFLTELSILPRDDVVHRAKARPHEGVDATADLHVPADGSDVSLILPQAIRTLKAGTTVTLQPKGRYGLKQPMQLTGIRNLKIDGRGAVFSRGEDSSRGPYIAVDECSGLGISNIEIAGKETTFRYARAAEFEPGIAVTASKDVTLEDIRVHDVGGDAVQSGRHTQNLVVRRLDADHTRRQGVSFNDGDGFTLEDSTFEWIGRSVIDVEPYRSNWSANNVVIRRNRATHFTNFFLAAAGDGPHQGMVVENNSVVGGLGFATIGNYRKNADGTRTPVPAHGVVIRGNQYDFADPANVQNRNLTALNVVADDDVVIADNSLRFFCEDSVVIASQTAHVSHNRLSGVDTGLDIRTLSPACPTVLDNEITDRRGGPAATTITPPPNCRPPSGP